MWVSVYGCAQVTLGGICLPLLVALSGFVAQERQDTHLLVLLLETELSLEYFAAVAIFMVWQVRKNISFPDNSMTLSFIRSSSTKVSSGILYLPRALGSVIKPRIPVLEPTIQTSQSQQWVSGLLHPEPGCGVCLLSWCYSPQACPVSVAPPRCPEVCSPRKMRNPWPWL